jgi:HK97 family phage prohead protease
MDLAEWREKAKAGAAPTGVILRKEFVPDEVKVVEGADRVIRFVISTGAVDRSSATVNPDGWLLDSYKKNPVVLWSHMYREPPVARSIDIAVSAGRLVSDAEFVTREIYPFADTVFQMLKAGFLRACSVGFDPISSGYNSERHGIDFFKQELLEYSVTPVGCNPEALVEAKSVGIDVEPLKAWAERALDEWGGEKGIWIPRSRLEAARKAIAPKTFQILGIKDDGAPEIGGDAGECPMGSECPMEEDAESCPNGEKCDKKATPAPEKAAPASLNLVLDLGPLKAMLEEKLGGFDAKLREAMTAAQKLALPSGATLAIDGQVLAGDFTLEVAPDDPGPQEKLFQFDPEELRGVVSDALHAEMTTITGKLYDRS